MEANLKQKSDKRLAKEKRVADALRENLRKRKQQVQKRAVQNEENK